MVTSALFDAADRQIAAIDALNARTSFSLDALGRTVAVQNPLGYVRSTVFDALSRAQASVDPFGSRWSSVFDEAGRQIAQVNPLAARYSSVFDNASRAIASVNPAGARTSQAYDVASQQIATQDALGYLHSTVFDALGRVQASVNPLAARWTSLFDNASQGIAQIDPLANRISTVFDPVGRVQATQDARGYFTSFVLDAAGQQIALVDANGGRWSGLFDVRGLQYATQDPLGAFSTLQFDPNTNILYRTDARGRVTSFTADALNRTAGQLYPDSTRVTNTWDPAGRQLTMQDVTGITSFGWDAADRQTSVIQPLINRPLTYTLDALGQRLAMVDIESQRFSYSWDPASRLVQIVNPYAEITSLIWDVLDREQRRVLGNSVSVSHTYDSAGNETLLENRKSDGAALSVYSATYDQVGNRLSVAELDGARVSYLHDASYQLYNENRSGANAFNYTLSYDPVGNRFVKVEGAQRTTHQFNAANELTLTQPPTGQPTTSSWDANGNLLVENTGGALTTHSWDSENRLVRIDNSDGTNEQYTYSADGMREKKVAGGSTILFVRDDQNVLVETDGALVAQAKYTDLPGIWGGKYSQRRSGASRLYLPDYQGHTRQLADPSQAASDTLLVDAWGVEIATAGATVNPFKAFGQWGYYRESAVRQWVGLRSLGVPYGRWTSREPLGIGGGDSNLYSYVSNRAANNVDPSGLVRIVPRGDWHIGTYDPNAKRMGGRMICCGAYAAHWHFELETEDGLAPCDGYFVQFVTVSATITNCPFPYGDGSDLDSHTCRYTEIFDPRFPKGSKIDPKRPVVDHFKYGGYEHAVGSRHAEAEVKFVCEADIKRQGWPLSRQRFKRNNKDVCIPPHGAQAGPLFAREGDPPTWWSLASADGATQARTHSADANWCCCGPDKRLWTSITFATPPIDPLPEKICP